MDTFRWIEILGHKNMNNDMNELQNKTSDSKQNSRRGFIQKAAIGAPILSTLASKSVLADTIISISGNLSNNTSAQTRHVEVKFNGCSKGFWHKTSRFVDPNYITGNTMKLRTWVPETYLGFGPDTSFNSIFGSSSNTDPIIVVAGNGKGQVDEDVLEHSTLFGSALSGKFINGSTPTELDKHTAAVYLNAASGIMTKAAGGYSPQQIVEFYEWVHQDYSNREADAVDVMTNLIHNGNADSEGCSSGVAFYKSNDDDTQKKDKHKNK